MLKLGNDALDGHEAAREAEQAQAMSYARMS